MSFKLLETYSVSDYEEHETWECGDCGNQVTLLAGGEPSCCMCEFEHEGETNE